MTRGTKILHLLVMCISFATVVKSWQVPDILQSVFQSSSRKISPIPQFILDTQHPWLEKNKGWLEKYPDVQDELCNKSSIMWQEGVNGKTIPQDLFHRLEIDNNRYGIDRKPWQNAEDRLNEMKACPVALEDVRHLYVDIYASTTRTDSREFEQQPPPTQALPAAFAEVVGSMRNLEKLDLGISVAATSSFEQAFRDLNVTLPSIRQLKPGKYSHWLLSHTPNLEVLEGGDGHWSWGSYDRDLQQNRTDARLELVEAARGKQIRDLSMSFTDEGRGAKGLEVLEKILEVTPHIDTLEVKGRLSTAIKDRYSYHASGNVTEYRELLRPYTELLAKLTKLEDLRLPHSFELGLGFDGGNPCGNAYMGPDGASYAREVLKEGIEVSNAVGSIMIDELPRLRKLTIGGHVVNVTVGEDGTTEVKWPWSGRIMDYLFEVHPDGDEASFW